ncbi:hypothetical protein TRFO_00867 [Tritrichomonas foetus]|uniref:Uncharacterized protein n=1 Tax=Tritrichomonas foetus TaxID=1144522 RepID=A0A1J4L271_9EUKA|nr:hypothetical protein TRFO_00867 [Tritrichomonas foetus]|eukprot:OHT17609.1 hypothetical protein TRFO_00867 [Tritrichomonas foetus]
MEIREQIESDLRAVASSPLPANVKKAMDQVIFRLRTQTSPVEIIEVNDPFVFLFEEITKDKKLINESIAILSTIRTLLEIGAIDGRACTKIFSIIDSLLQSAPESFMLKVLQISLASFTSPSANLEPRITATKWIFQMTGNIQSQTIPHVATAMSYQLLDVAFDKAMGNSGNAKKMITPQNSLSPDFDNTAELLINQNGEQASDNDGSQGNQSETELESTKIADPNDWSITFIFTLMTDILLFITNSEPKMFKKTFTKANNFPLLLLKYILDKHFTFLSYFQPQFKTNIELLFKFVTNQTDPTKFSMFIPHLVVNLTPNDPQRIMPLFSKVVSLVDSYPYLLNAIATTISCCPSLQFTTIPTDELLKLGSFSSKFFTTNFKGILSDPIIIYGSNRPGLASYDPFDQGINKILVSSVVILYQEILQCAHNTERFIAVFNLFDGVWQRVIQATQDPITLGTSLKIARTCVRYSIRQKQIDPAQRIFSTLCGFAVPTSAAFSLVAKGVIALHSITRLLQQMKAQIYMFWPLIFETISLCHHTAAHKRSAADTQALKLIQPSLLSFSTEINDELFTKLFGVIKKLSEEEYKTFIERKGTVPNFWPFKTLAYIFGLNITRVSEIEDSFFDHLGYLLQCDSPEYRTQATNSLFEISKNVVNSQNSTQKCRQRIFDYIFQAANSNHRDVSVAAFNGLLPFLAGGTAMNIGDGWPMVLTILKVVWATPFPENIQNGFRVLTFICSDCLMYLKVTDLEVCLSTISAYIMQMEDINIALGTIGLLWNVGSSLSTDNNDCWRALFKTLQNNFADKRQNIRESSLQTFFSLVNTFFGQFSSELRLHVLENVISPLVMVIAKNDSPLLAIQGVTQCLRSLGDYQGIIDKLINGIESISMKTESGIKAGEATRCYIPLFFFDDPNISKKVTLSFKRTVAVYVSNPKKSDLQGAVSVVTDVFPKIADKIDDDEFEDWLKIIEYFCTFQVDKPFLHVSTHAAMNVQNNLPSLKESRIIELIKLDTNLIEYGCQPLTAKCFETLATLYVKMLDEKGRANCLIQILPLLQKMLNTQECMECFKLILDSKLSLDIILSDRKTVCRLVEIGRRMPIFRQTIVKLMSEKMNLIQPDVFPIFLSLGRESPILFQFYFEKFCSKDSNDPQFFQLTKETVKKAIEAVTNLLIGEEKALGSVLRKQQYQGIIDFFIGLKDLETEPKLYNDKKVKGTKGHLLFLLQSIIKLSETKSTELRSVIQEILQIVTL